MGVNVVAVGAVTAALAIAVSHVVRLAFLSPLCKVPAPHWSCHFLPLWYWWAKLTHRENRLVLENHLNKGQTLRLAPHLLSLNCFEGGLKPVYLGGFPKTEFYTRGFMNYDTHNIFTFEDNATHSARKRIISSTFSKSFLSSNPTARASTKNVLFGKLMPLLKEASEAGDAVEVLELSYSYSMDSFVAWQFGNSLGSNLIGNKKERRLYLDGFFAAAPYTFWQFEFPGLNTLFKVIGLIPKKVDSGFQDLEKWNLEKCDRAQELLAQGEEKLSSDDKPVVFAQALKAMSDIDSKPKAYPRRIEIASDMFAHNSAAHETSGNTLTFCLYELSRRPDIQSKLRKELLTLDPPLFIPAEEEELVLPTVKNVDTLPYLEAVIMETLRLYPSVSGGQPRRVPRPCTLGGYDHIPAGTTVQCYAYALHRTPEIFPEPLEWKPERWIESEEDHLRTMRRWFWAFGSGGRMCIGSNFSYFSIKHAVGAIYTNFTTTVHSHGSMELEDAYLAGPSGHKLELKFHRVLR